MKSSFVIVVIGPVVAVALLVAAGCGAVSRAERLIEAGELAEADRILVDEVQRHPNNLEGHFQLGRARLLRNRTEDARRIFATLETSPSYARRIAEIYWHFAVERGGEEDQELVVHSLRRAAALNPELAGPACVAGLTVARRLTRRNSAAREVLAGIAEIDDECRTRVVKFIATTIGDASVLDLHAVQGLSSLAIRLDPESRTGIAESMIDRAWNLGAVEQEQAINLVHRAAMLDEAVGLSGRAQSLRMRAGATAAVGGEEGGSGRRIQMTLDALDDVGRRIAFHPQPGTLRARMAGNCADLIDRRFRSALPLDGWGSELVCARDGWMIRVISGGADRAVDPSSTGFTGRDSSRLDSPGADFIWENGSIVQRPTLSAVARSR